MLGVHTIRVYSQNSDEPSIEDRELISNLIKNLMKVHFDQDVFTVTHTWAAVAEATNHD